MNIGSRDMSGGSNSVNFQGNQINAIGSTVYQTLMLQSSSQHPGRSPTIDRVNLTRLVDVYTHEDGWMCPLPWDPSIRFPPEEYYIELDLDVFDRTGTFQRSMQTQVEELFDSLERGTLPVARVLVRGHAGFGKTSLCAKTVHDWSKGATTFRAKPWETTLPILYRLRSLKREQSLEEELISRIRSSYREEVSTEELESFLKGLGRNLLLILDGVDELDEAGQQKVKDLVSWEENHSVFNGASFLVTSRFTSEQHFLKLFEKHFMIRRISQDKVERIIECFEKNWPCPSLLKPGSTTTQNELFPKTFQIEWLIQKNTGRNLQLKLLSPLIVSLICWLVRQQYFLYDVKCIIYSSMLLLCKRCNEREGFGFTVEQMEDALWLLGVLVYLSDSDIMIHNNNLELCFQDKQIKFLTLTGILKSGRSQEEWEPVHLSFIETLTERVFERILRCLPEGKELGLFLGADDWLVLDSGLHFHFRTGSLQRVQIFLHRRSCVYVTYDNEVKELAINKGYFVANEDQSIMIKIFFSGRKQLRTFSEFSRNSCKCSHCLNVLKVYSRNIRLVYTLEDDEKETLDNLFCVQPESALTRWFQVAAEFGISITVPEGHDIRRASCYVFEKLFDLSDKTCSERETPCLYFKNFLHSLQKASTNNNWGRLGIYALSRDCNKNNLKITFPEVERNEVEATDQLLDTNYTWDELREINFRNGGDLADDHFLAISDALPDAWNRVLQDVTF